MPFSLRKGIWSALNTDIQIPWSSIVPKSAEALKTTLEIAKVLKENRQAKELSPLIGQIHSLLDVLNSPLAQVVGSGIPFVPLGVGLLKFIAEQTRQEPSIEICVGIVGQAAFLKSWQQFLSDYSCMYPSLDMKSETSESIANKLEELAEVEICEREAQEALVCFHNSKLAEKLNLVMVARLKEAGLEEKLARRLTERVSRNVHRYIKQVLSEAKESVIQLANLYGGSWENELQDQISLDSYLQDQISSKTRIPEHQSRWRVFDEQFTIKDIYVPLEAQPLDKLGKASDHSPISLNLWAEQYLDDSNQTRHKQVMFIQAAPGRGKTIFCRMFADWVRENLYPIWTPILIRLRDIGTLETNFEVTLQASVNARFAKDDRWLHNPNIRFLFLLDGFDELLMEGRTTGGLKKFLEQVGQFQQACQVSAEMQHRVLITGRTLALQDIERALPSNLERVEILPMSKISQEKWLTQWGEQIGSEQLAGFRAFLGSPNIPQSIVGTNGKVGLAQEPLLLYLLAAMHRDQKLTAEMFEGIKVEPAKILIYERSLEWALNRRRSTSEMDDNLDRRLIMLDPEEVRRILQEAGLCVVQSGGEWASINMIGERLKDDENASQFLEEAQKEVGENPLRNALVSFYLQPASNRREGGVEFVHKSFGEFLCAERIKESFELWAKPGEHRKRKYYIDTPKMNEEIYDLFGFGYLSPEVIDFLIGLIASEIEKNSEQEQERICFLFKRLETFFEIWCRGEFIDDCVEKIPIKTAQRLKPFLVNSVGQRQVDVYTGLNIFIILMRLYQMGIPELKFNLCKSSDDSDTWLKLSSVISYCNVLGSSTFVEIAGRFMSKAQLENAHLRRVDLKGANFLKANLSGADLCRADLTGANFEDARMVNVYLRGADLKEVNLTDAKLNNADLCRSYLRNANLSRANLSNASVKGANFEGANLESAILKNVVWDATTQWFCSEGLHRTQEVPTELTAYEDFCDSRELSNCLDSLKSQSRQHRDESLSNTWNNIANRIKNRRGSAVYAHVMNKFAWLSCLYGLWGKDIVNISREAVANSPNTGNYKDTFAITLVMYYDATGVPLLLDNLDTNETTYRNSIRLFNEALNSDDFRKLALPDGDKMRQRRIDWIEELNQDRNPFTDEALGVLLREER